MTKRSPTQQFLAELAKLGEEQADDLCLALVCLLRFGLTRPLKHFLTNNPLPHA